MCDNYFSIGNSQICSCTFDTSSSSSLFKSWMCSSDSTLILRTWSLLEEKCDFDKNLNLTNLELVHTVFSWIIRQLTQKRPCGNVQPQKGQKQQARLALSFWLNFFHLHNFCRLLSFYCPSNTCSVLRIIIKGSSCQFPFSMKQGNLDCF